MSATVADIINAMDAIAPIRLAEDWDNVGLHVGRRDWAVNTVWIALDPSPEVVAAACSQKVDLLITHHPLIFKPLRSIDFRTPVGASIQMAIENHLAIFSAHTNLDIAVDGLNDVLAGRIELRNIEPLDNTRSPDIYKLVVYVPAEYEQQFLTAMLKTQIGRTGNYGCCSFRNAGQGIRKQIKSGRSFGGNTNEFSQVDEIRVETVVGKDDLSSLLEELKRHHPYEAMAYDLYPLVQPENIEGLGRIGELSNPFDLKSLALKVKKSLGLASVKVAGDLKMSVTKVAVCTGSGSNLVRNFIRSGAQVYISGDFRYHDAKEILAEHLGLIDIGHFASEHLIIEVLAERLARILAHNGHKVDVKPYRLEKDPFVSL